MRVTCSAHLNLLNSIILIIYNGELKIIKLLTIQFSPTSSHFLHPRSKYSPQHPVQNTFCQCPHLLARRFFTSLKKKSQLVGLYTLIFTFLHTRWGGNSRWASVYTCHYCYDPHFYIHLRCTSACESVLLCFSNSWLSMHNKFKNVSR